MSSIKLYVGVVASSVNGNPGYVIKSVSQILPCREENSYYTVYVSTFKGNVFELIGDISIINMAEINNQLIGLTGNYDIDWTSWIQGRIRSY